MLGCRAAQTASGVKVAIRENDSHQRYTWVGFATIDSNRAPTLSALTSEDAGLELLMALVRTIEHSGVVIAQIYDLKSVEGTNFPTPPDFPMQFGVGSYPNGRDIPPHVHTRLDRKLDVTSEFIFILEGAMKVVFLDEEGRPVGEHRLDRQMCFLQVVGGHHIVFEPGTKYFEIKQGPYLGREIEKRDVTL
jgi:mannose-6-phosphate isomerase-like protein (cupin superfamily)